MNLATKCLIEARRLLTLEMANESTSRSQYKKSARRWRAFRRAPTIIIDRLKLSDDEFDKRVRLLGFVRDNEYLSEDVFLASFPKSGNTWFRNLVAGVVYGIDPERAPYSLISDIIPEHGNRYYKRYATPMFFKSHFLPRRDYKRVVYLLRDGRDAMVSCYHHLLFRERKKVDLMSVVRGEERIFPYYKWHEHVEAWLSNPFQAQMIIIRYEDLKKDPVKQLRRFCEFVRIERDDATLRLMSEKASFDRMRAKEARDGTPGWPKDKFAIRRGQVGSYKDEMPAEVLETFLAEAGDTMRKVQYL